MSKIFREISVVLPCFNEAKNIESSILSIQKYLEKNFEAFEIVAVNDGSTDETLNKLQKMQKDGKLFLKIVNRHPNEGKGNAVKEGVMNSRYSLVMFMDADHAIPIEELGNFVLEIQKGTDIVIASRFVTKIKILRPILWYRSIMEKVFRILRMIIINNYDIQDTQCGFKVFTREAALRIFPLLTVKRFSFDVEVIYLAKKMGLSVEELPITLQNPPESHIRIVRDSLNMFFDLFRIRWNDLKGRYK